MNPLDTPEIFSLDLMNPNPTSTKTKDGPKYRVSFELEKDDWQMFMDANTQGMIIEVRGRVVEKHEEKPKGGPVSKNAGMLCQDDNANKWAQNQGFTDLKDMIYVTCNIRSRAQLDHQDLAALEYEGIKSRFMDAMELEYQ